MNMEIVNLLKEKQYLRTIKTNDLYEILKTIYEYEDVGLVPRDVVRGWFENNKTYKNAQLLEIIYGPESLVYFYDDEKLSKAYKEKMKDREEQLEFEKLQRKLETKATTERLKFKKVNNEISLNPKNRSRIDYIGLSDKDFDKLLDLDVEYKEITFQIGDFKKDQKISTDSTLSNMIDEQEIIALKIQNLENINESRK